MNKLVFRMNLIVIFCVFIRIGVFVGIRGLCFVGLVFSSIFV